ncbi:MAG: preprotein translocase subunit SecG [Desulfovibrionaceae bacterium]|nr:preprotein translocase subunit SecG [Desulfovibrionaceae bacterium]
MQTLILTLHIIVCVLLVILILLQAGKEGMGVIFGGGNSSVFGSSGAGGILAKLTTLMALIFVITSLSYTYVTSSHPESESVILKTTIEEPAVPAAPQVAPEAAPAAPEAVPAEPESASPASEQPAPQADQPSAAPAPAAP